MGKNDRLFVASIIALVTTSFGFVVRAFLLTEWGVLFNLTETQKGALQGAGLFPFALSIIFFSLFIDRLGYGRAMVFAWVGHVVSAVVCMTAHSYAQLYVGTLIFALANGVVEAVVNPVVATLYPRDKVRHLNLLHSGWAGGFVLGGMLFIAMGATSWQFKIGLFLLPTFIYGAMMLGCRFPVQERVRAGVSYRDMLGEFGWAGCLIVSYFMAEAIDAVGNGMFNASLPNAAIWLITLVPTAIFAAKVRRFGRPMFIFLLLIMILSATTELGTDSWVSDLLTPVLRGLGSNAGSWVLVYTSAIMLVLRIFGAGPLVRALSPVGLLAICSLLAAAGLFLLAHAGAAAGVVFVAATLYGIGKSFFWPTTLGVVSEQFPRGGALTLNAMGGMGMIAVGVLGVPLLGTLQDQKLDHSVMSALPALHAQVAEPSRTTDFIHYQPLDKRKIAALPPDERAAIEQVIADNKQLTLARFAVLPMLMALGFAILLGWFAGRGGYKPVGIGSDGH